jgi:hypothetical protein
MNTLQQSHVEQTSSCVSLFFQEAFLVEELVKTRKRTQEHSLRWTLANKFVQEYRLFLLLTHQTVHNVIVPQLRSIALNPDKPY